ncbi:putative glycolipid-binding domain-containing protein [Mesorhizobium sp.]|uniref:putative glycolipid-binding domain-containing protein n=2 Tax=Mesorhizobium sp. TaxID=1871066 RepID=UPI00343C6578
MTPKIGIDFRKRIMRKVKLLQRPLRVRENARRCRALGSRVLGAKSQGRVFRLLPHVLPATPRRGPAFRRGSRPCRHRPRFHTRHQSSIRRLGPGPGETPAPAAYLAFPQLEFVRLDQTYRRLDENRYAYTAPVFGYEAVLDVSPIDLWTSVARPG